VRDILRRTGERLDPGVAHADIIRKEYQVELGALGGLRDLDIVLKVDAGVGLRIWMPPGGDMMPGRIEEGAEPHLAFAAHPLQSWSPNPVRRASRIIAPS